MVSGLLGSWPIPQAAGSHLEAHQSSDSKLLLRIVLATQAISNVIKSSFGPSGLDKMMVDEIGVSS